MGINEFGVRLTTTRKELGLTQEQLAARLGVTPQAVSRWERGNGYPDMELLYYLCEVLNCSADYLISRTTASSRLTESRDEKEAERLLEKVLAEPLTLEVGSGLTELLIKEYQELFPDIRTLRESMAAEYGFLLPVLRIRDNEKLDMLEIRILAYEEILSKEQLEGVTEDTFRDICSRLRETVLNHIEKIVNRQMIQLLVDNLSEHYPAAVHGVVPDKIPLSRLQAVLAAMIRKRKSIRSLIKILEIMEDSEDVREVELLADRIIERLKIK